MNLPSSSFIGSHLPTVFVAQPWRAQENDELEDASEVQGEATKEYWGGSSPSKPKEAHKRSKSRDAAESPWHYDEGMSAPKFKAEIRAYTMRVVKRVYPIASTTWGSRVQHWAISLTPLEEELAEELGSGNILIEFSPSGVCINNDGGSAHDKYLGQGQIPECTELGCTAKTMDEMRVWIFDKFKVYRDDNFEGFGRQHADVVEYDILSMNCQNFATMLSEFLRTPITTHSQATEVVGGVAAVGGLALAGCHAPVVIAAGGALAGAAAAGMFENVTENAGIASLGNGVSILADGVDKIFCGVPRFMVKSSASLAATAVAAPGVVLGICRGSGVPTTTATAANPSAGDQTREQFKQGIKHPRLVNLDNFYKHDPLGSTAGV